MTLDPADFETSAISVSIILPPHAHGAAVTDKDLEYCDLLNNIGLKGYWTHPATPREGAARPAAVVPAQHFAPGMPGFAAKGRPLYVKTGFSPIGNLDPGSRMVTGSRLCFG
jgi:hypothetical protein